MTETLTRAGRGTERQVGRPVDRRDGTAKATGAATYAGEYPYPDLAHAVLVHATIARGRVTDIDTAAALAVPEVLDVLTHRNAPAMKGRRRTLVPSLLGSTVTYLQTGEVHWDGQPVAVVVADTLAAAEEAAALVGVSYQRHDADVDFAAELSNAEPDKPMLPGMPAGRRVGDAEAELAVAPVSVDVQVTTPPYNHNAIEPHATTAAWNGDHLTVHDAVQGVNSVRLELAHRFGVPAGNVRVFAPYVGGGFGGKGIWPTTLLAPLAARVVGRPVRLVMSREGVYRTVGGRTPTVQRVAIGARRDGDFTALIHTSVTRNGRTGGMVESVTGSSGAVYPAKTLLLGSSSVELDVPPNTAMRAPGEAVGSIGLEIAVDEVAAALGTDPVDLRLRNAPDLSGGRRLRLRELYSTGAEEFGWANRAPEPGAMRDGRWLVGMGTAAGVFPAGAIFADAVVRLSAEGTVLVRCGFQEMGMGAATAAAQVTADQLRVPLDAVRVEYGDTSLPWAPPAAGSMHTASVVNGLLAACAKLKRDVETRARRAGVGPTDYAGVLRATGTPYVEARNGRLGTRIGQVRSVTRLVRDTRNHARSSSCAHFCEVRVDADTGEVRVSRWLAVADVGTVLNAKLVASQLRGGIVMGIGMALTEETLVDPRTGRIMNPHLSDYHIPVHADVPRIDIRCLDDPDPDTPMGMYGAGELGICGAAAAVVNAVHHATGTRVRDLPVTPDKIFVRN